MADTIPDTDVPNNSWINAYTETGIASGSNISITNKSSYEILVQEIAAKPADDNNDGKIIATLSTGNFNIVVTGAPPGVWLKSTGNAPALVNIQQV